jgi:hypothetical protein
MWLEIPRLGIKQIYRRPLVDGKWDLSCYPARLDTWKARPTISARQQRLDRHVYDSNGAPGPFRQPGKIELDDQVILHANGSQYVYAVRQNKIVSPRDTSPLKPDNHSLADAADLPWLRRGQRHLSRAGGRQSRFDQVVRRNNGRYDTILWYNHTYDEEKRISKAGRREPYHLTLFKLTGSG